MFLALREFRHQPTRFTLIIAVITLVSFLTFFLAALAAGLAHSYRSAIDDWGASGVALTEASNGNIAASRLTPEQVSALPNSETSATLISAGVVAQDTAGTKNDAMAFGVTPGSFLTPTVTEGETPQDPTRQVLADDSFKDNGWKIGETFTLNSSDHVWEVSGFTDDQSFQGVPVIFFDQDTLAAHAPSNVSPTPNAVVSRDAQGSELVAEVPGLEVFSTADFISTLPGYSAQTLTFSLMIGSLILIASFVLGIFIYVLTLQKRSVLGILKARGVPTSQLITSGAAQTSLLAAAGVAAGIVLTALTALVLPQAVPFRVDPLVVVGITAAFLSCSLLGGLISVRVVARIDPVEAIS